MTTHRATLTITDPSWTALGLNLRRSSGKRAANRRTTTSSHNSVLGTMHFKTTYIVYIELGDLKFIVR